MKLNSVIRDLFIPVIGFLKAIAITILAVFLISVIGFIVGFFVIYKINPFRMSATKLASLKIKIKIYDFMRWLIVDFLTRGERKGDFKKYGFTIFCGRQGSGKTISLVNELNNIHEEYPKCKIVTNFKYEHAHHIMKDWKDFFEIRNGTDGVVFAIDEIQTEYSAESWKDFPEALLSEISMQRKERIKIFATSQVFSRVAKQIREQTFSVVMCNTYFGRWTFCKEYDGAEYSTSDTPYTIKEKCRPMFKWSFVQSNNLRSCYDTYEKIERMRRTNFIPRKER